MQITKHLLKQLKEKTVIITNVGKAAEQLDHVYIADRNVNGTVTLENSLNTTADINFLKYHF